MSTSYSDKLDRLVLETILVGCSKMIWGLVGERPEKQARVLNKKNVKSLTRDFIIYEIMKHPVGDKITWKNMKNKLLGKIPLTYESYVSQGFTLSKKSGLVDVLKKEWGRPGKKKLNKDSSLKKFEITSDYDNVTKILHKDDVLYLLRFFLNGSGLLYRYFKHIKMISLYLCKMNSDDPNRAWEITKNVFSFDKKDLKFDEHFKNAISLKNKGELQKLAHDYALWYIETKELSDYVGLYKSGYQFFRV